MNKPLSGNASRFTLRRARQSDCEFAKRLYVDSMKLLLSRLGAWNEQEILSKFDRYFELDKARIISVHDVDAGWLQVSETEYAINLDQIYLAEGFRRQGIGSRLIGDLLATAETKKKPILLSLVCNNPALGLYQRLGFRTVRQDDNRRYMRWDAP